MIRLENETQVIYDANVIIYSLFPEKYKIPLLTALAKDLNNFLFNQESTIVVPHFIICEIERKGYYKVIDDYFVSSQMPPFVPDIWGLLAYTLAVIVKSC